jgi:hypothetical protein
METKRTFSAGKRRPVFQADALSSDRTVMYHRVCYATAKARRVLFNAAFVTRHLCPCFALRSYMIFKWIRNRKLSRLFRLETLLSANYWYPLRHQKTCELISSLTPRDRVILVKLTVAHLVKYVLLHVPELKIENSKAYAYKHAHALWIYHQV